MLPNHDHGGGVELAVAEQLAADIFTHFWLAGAYAISDVLIGTHGAGSVLDYVRNPNSTSWVIAGDYGLGA